MNTDADVAPAVRSILRAARSRPGGGERLAFDARSLPAAVAAAEADGRVVRGEFRPDSPDPAPGAGGSDEAVGEGWYAGAGYSLWRALDLMVRWDSYRAPASDRRGFVVLGADLWVGMESRLGFHLAFQTDGPEVFPEGAGLPAASATPGGLTDGQAVIRLQVGF
jgi:hypothetical protein